EDRAGEEPPGPRGPDGPRLRGRLGAGRQRQSDVVHRDPVADLPRHRRQLAAVGQLRPLRPAPGDEGGGPVPHLDLPTGSGRPVTRMTALRTTAGSPDNRLATRTREPPTSHGDTRRSGLNDPTPGSGSLESGTCNEERGHHGPLPSSPAAAAGGQPLR